jgi:hypothetical protein
VITIENLSSFYPVYASKIAPLKISKGLRAVDFFQEQGIALVYSDDKKKFYIFSILDQNPAYDFAGTFDDFISRQVPL